MASLVKRKSSPAAGIDAGGPIEDTDIAIQNMKKDCGFDLNKDNINRGMFLFMGGSSKYCEYWLTPMAFILLLEEILECVVFCM
jgi:hypothetical protein